MEVILDSFLDLNIIFDVFKENNEIKNIEKMIDWKTKTIKYRSRAGDRFIEAIKNKSLLLLKFKFNNKYCSEKFPKERTITICPKLGKEHLYYKKEKKDISKNLQSWAESFWEKNKPARCREALNYFILAIAEHRFVLETEIPEIVKYSVPEYKEIIRDNTITIIFPKK